MPFDIQATSTSLAFWKNISLARSVVCRIDILAEYLLLVHPFGDKRLPVHPLEPSDQSAIRKSLATTVLLFLVGDYPLYTPNRLIVFPMSHLLY
jgi:hypothetical protein